MKNKLGNGMACLCMLMLLPSCMMMFPSYQPVGGHRTHDPVCGQRIERDSSLRAEWNDRIYYFDSEECKKVFLRNPEQFASGKNFHRNIYPIAGDINLVSGVVIMTVMMLVFMTSFAFIH